MEQTITRAATVNARISPVAGLDILSRHEVARLRDAGAGGLHELLRRCALAVLTQGSITDDARFTQQMRADLDFRNPVDSPGGFFGTGLQLGQGQNWKIHTTSQELRLVSASSGKRVE